MVFLIARHTAIKNLRDFRILLLLGLVIAMLTLSGLVTAYDLERERGRRSALTSAALDQSNLEMAVVVKPRRPLRFVHTDIEDQLPDYLTVAPGLVDHPEPGVGLRELSPGLQTLDWTFVAIHFLTLVCLLVTFDAVSGESERGTLRQVLVNGASRKQYYLGSLAGSLMSILPVIAVGFLINILTVQLLTDLRLSQSDWWGLLLAIGGICLLTLTYCLLGLMASALVSSAGMSLLLALAIWVGTVFALPTAGRLAAGYLAPIPSISKLEESLRGAQRRFYKQSFPLSSNDIQEIAERKNLSESAKQAEIDRLQEEIDQQNLTALERFRRSVIEVREDFLRRLEQQAGLAKTLSRASPVSAYQEFASVIAGTGFAGYLEFVADAQDYRQAFEDFVKPLRLRRLNEAETRDITIMSDGFQLRNVLQVSYAKLEFDHRNYPRFRPRTHDPLKAGVRAWPALLAFVVVCAGAFLWGLAAFVRNPSL